MIGFLDKNRDTLSPTVSSLMRCKCSQVTVEVVEVAMDSLTRAFVDKDGYCSSVF